MTKKKDSPLNIREISTVLAALRMYQENIDLRNEDIATNMGTVKPLNNMEIDRLCERINS